MTRLQSLFGACVAFFKSCLFPVHCLSCKKEGVWICEACVHAVPWDGVFCCPVCHEPAFHGICCPRCAPASALTLVMSSTPYHDDWLISRIMDAWKYQHAEEVIQPLVPLLSAWVKKHAITLAVDMVVPVPIHPRRHAERGFHQAEVLARVVAEALSAPMEAALQRARYTKPQARLTKQTRLQNVEGAFVLTKETSVRGKKILLVDDVYTTGSTMQACARVLRANGCTHAFGVTLARG